MSSGYPSSDEYNMAVQMPTASFVDSELKTAKVKTNAFGYPIALGGGFALTYEMMTAGRKRLAVRCFHKQANGLEAKYARISSCLASVGGAGPFVRFEFQCQGIRVNSRPFPVVKMDWADGETLGSYLETAYLDKAALGKLLTDFRELSKFLQSKAIAHGDLQNGNVLVGKGGLTLIDYDGMYVPGMATGNGSELGQLHFQHPKRLADDFGPTMDRFSLIVIDVSLRALMERPQLFQKHSSGENILLSAADYRAPSTSPVFADLRAIPTIASDVDQLASLCVGPVSAVPSLEDFLVGRGVDSTIVIRPATATTPAAVPGAYIGAYPVIDGADFAAVVTVVGDKIELIARIMEVREAKTKYGRPYVFLNFGHWKNNIAKVNIWSSGLKKFANPPNNSWEGKWVSVTGLVDPVWENEKYNHRHVAITVSDSSQIRVITETEAKRRLTSRFPIAQPATTQYQPSATPPRPAVQSGPSNSDILRGMKQGSRVRTAINSPPTVARPAVQASSAPAGGKSPNQEILDRINRSQGTSAAQRVTSVRPSPPPSPPTSPPPWTSSPPPYHPATPPYRATPQRQKKERGLMHSLGSLIKGLFGR